MNARFDWGSETAYGGGDSERSLALRAGLRTIGALRSRVL
jgi:hypothetical protein